MILLGDCGIAVAGGAEAMSRASHIVQSARFGQRMGGIEMIDALVATLSDPSDGYHMGITSENVAADWGAPRRRCS